MNNNEQTLDSQPTTAELVAMSRDGSYQPKVEIPNLQVGEIVPDEAYWAQVRENAAFTGELAEYFPGQESEQWAEATARQKQLEDVRTVLGARERELKRREGLERARQAKQNKADGKASKESKEGPDSTGE